MGEISKRGYEAYIAGGAVRDLVRHHLHMANANEVHDVDIATNMPIEELKQAFRCDSNNGEAHGTILVHYDGMVFEVTQFRVDGDYSDGRHPDSVEFAKTFKEDCSRRDFTINAMGLDKDMNVIDYFDGIGDLVFRRLRAVGNPFQRFTEDALRVIRGMRFAARYDLMIDDQTKQAMHSRIHLVPKLAMERIHDELYKCAGYGKRQFSAMIGYMSKFGFCNVFPEYGLCLDRQRLMVERMYDDSSATQIMGAFFCMTSEDTMRAFRCSKEEISLAKTVRKNIMDIVCGKFGKLYDPESLVYSVELVTKPEFAMTYTIFNGLFPDACYIKSDAVRYCQGIANVRKSMSEYGKIVKAEGVPQGPEFGKRLKEVIAEDYKKLLEDAVNYEQRFARKW